MSWKGNALWKRYPENKKFRGKRGFFRILRWYSCTYKIDLSTDSWFDLEHEHFDWHGRGNLKPRIRKQFLKAFFTAYERVTKQIEVSGRPCQTFLNFCVEDSSQDAIYFHTPNPNEDNFPHSFDYVSWDSAVPVFLERFVDLNRHQIGKTLFDDKTWYVVRMKE